MTRHKPWKHQQKAYEFAVDHADGCMLAMAPGTGKTKVTIDLIQNHPIRLTLIACPKPVIDVWVTEVGKHARNLNDFCVVAMTERMVKDRTLLAATLRETSALHTVLVGNYDMMWREPFRSWALDQQWDLVVADECHRLKTAGGKASFFFRTLRSRAGYCMGLSGTPIPHSPMDLYAQMRFINPSVFGTQAEAFRAQYALLGGYSGRQIIGWQNLDDMHAKFYAAAFRVDRDVLDLPPEVDTFRTTMLEPIAYRQYKELQKEFITQHRNGMVTTAKNALVKLLRLQQLAGGWLRRDEDGRDVEVSRAKRALFADTLADIPLSEPVVVFCRFKRELDVLLQESRQAGRIPAELSGRRDQRRDWTRGQASVLVAQIQAGAEGIDLTRSHYTIYYSMGFSLGQYVQSRMRTARPGQTAQTNFIHLLVKGTVDQHVYRALANRQKVVQQILRDGLDAPAYLRAA